MDYIATKIAEAPPILERMMAPQPRVELFKTVIRKDSGGIDREIPESIGIYTEAQITAEITALQERLAELNDKLAAVQAAAAQEVTK